MKLSTKGRYGARAMLNLALHDGKGPVSIKDIAKQEDISERYLENIMAKLVSGGLVRSIRGQNGGFLLARSPRDIKLGEVIQTLEGTLAPVGCVEGREHCKRSTACVTRDIWLRLRNVMIETLDAYTLYDMAEMHEKKQFERMGSMYYI